MRQTACALAAAVLALTFACATSRVAHAARYGVFVGPPALGIGDPNPVTFVSPVEYELHFVADNGLEFRAAIIGLSGGYRLSSEWGGYVSLGAGLVLDANGLGIGPSAAVGYDFFCVTVCATAEYFQATGISLSGMVAPYALRLGVSLAVE